MRLFKIAHSRMPSDVSTWSILSRFHTGIPVGSSRYETRCFVETKQRWMVLCEQAAVEQDSNKLMELTNEIIRLLDEREAANRSHQAPVRITTNGAAQASVLAVCSVDAAL